jgi:hypothetical protein
MKTLRLVLICAFIATAMVNNANADGFTSKPAKKVINMTLVQAIQNPGIRAAMLQQLDPSFLSNNEQSYIVDVTYQNYIIRIIGTYDQWALFFRNNWTDLGQIHPASVNEL